MIAFLSYRPQDCNTLYHYLQVDSSCYTLHHMKVGSWVDAEEECYRNGSHLWAINSHHEWMSIIESLETSHWVHQEIATNISTQKLLLTTLTFIGLVYSTDKPKVRTTGMIL